MDYFENYLGTSLFPKKLLKNSKIYGLGTLIKRYKKGRKKLSIRFLTNR